MAKKITIIAFITLLLIGALFYLRDQVYHSKGTLKSNLSFEIKEGEGNAQIAESLVREGLISNKIYFYYYIKSQNLVGKIMPGVYEFSGSLTIPEVVHIITNSEEQFIKITFPEGFTAQKMADRLNENKLPGDEFLKIAKNPGDLKKRYSYLTGDKVKTLEGYLFPDTYFFKRDMSAENIAGRLLDTFDEKLDDKMRQDIADRGKTINDIITMASILEREVQTAEDMKIVSGIFWKRLADGRRLESDATLSYFLNDKKDQHSGADLQIDSPYNSYMYSGLPPGPIGNPGLDAIEAAIHPQDSNYNFFLTANANGEKKVIYSATFDEHVANKRKYGL